jgi:hypothetical protein
LVHFPTSTVVPFGISVSTSLLVPGALRRLVSPMVAIGLAVAQTTDSNVKTTADAAILAKLMAASCSDARRLARFNCRAELSIKQPCG